MEALAGEMTPKFLATCSDDGIPNIVPCTSLTSAGDVENRLIFGNFLLRKSVNNLNQNPKVGIMVITPDLEGWILQGGFCKGILGNGSRPDPMRTISTTLTCYATTPTRAFVTRVLFRYEKLSAIFGSQNSACWLTRACSPSKEKGSSSEAVALPPVVGKNFSLLMAVRILTFLDSEGYPLVIPTLSLQPSGEDTLVCAPGSFGDILELLDSGSPVAASLLTFDAVSFQAKGRWLESKKFLGAPEGFMSVTSVYAGGPPIPGRQVA